MREVDRLMQETARARDVRNAAVVRALAGGVRPCDLARTTGLTIPNIRAIRLTLRV